MSVFFFTSYTSPDDGGNVVEESPTPIVSKAIEKLKDIEEQLNSAINGDEINIVSGDDEDDDSGSGSGSGDSGSGINVISESTDPPTTDSGNSLDEPGSDVNVLGGGVGGAKAGPKKNSASQPVVGVWLFCSAVLLLCSTLIP